MDSPFRGRGLPIAPIFIVFFDVKIIITMLGGRIRRAVAAITRYVEAAIVMRAVDGSSLAAMRVGAGTAGGAVSLFRLSVTQGQG
jgi:hypothetical protein